ncbi:hypothetical protein C8F04DRAFT_1402059 [Mycena alexandri]|uniref:Uncharacterized protein n=1 Tax=Mycena alexandri TaxID=1745969 RepID=A0AAD6WQ41_9AGAR|nr:hypothetical protein C8F04DRAFT_1402059 [Mycena alexandri]
MGLSPQGPCCAWHSHGVHICRRMRGCFQQCRFQSGIWSGCLHQPRFDSPDSWSHMMDSARCIARLAGRNNPGSLQYGDGNDPRVWGAVPHSRNMRGHHLLT